MRISKTESEIIKSKAIEVWGKDISILLFGSRVDDTKRGGDIDLYIELSEKMDSTEIIEKKAWFLTLLQLKLGNQKIDLVINNRDNARHQIMNTAKRTGVAL